MIAVLIRVVLLILIFCSVNAEQQCQEAAGLLNTIITKDMIENVIESMGTNSIPIHEFIDNLIQMRVKNKTTAAAKQYEILSYFGDLDKDGIPGISWKYFWQGLLWLFLNSFGNLSFYAIIMFLYDRLRQYFAHNDRTYDDTMIIGWNVFEHKLSDDGRLWTHELKMPTETTIDLNEMFRDDPVLLQKMHKAAKINPLNLPDFMVVTYSSWLTDCYTEILLVFLPAIVS